MISTCTAASSRWLLPISSTSLHPFVDGNKRTAAVSANAFLLINGKVFDPDDDEFIELVYATARGEKSKEDIAKFIEGNCHNLEP